MNLSIKPINRAGSRSPSAPRAISVGGYKSLFFSGEGLVCRFSGKGRVWIRTRQVPGFITWINPFRRVQKKKS